MSDRALIADALRAARANGWRPRYPQTRRLGQWTWTSVTQPHGLPPTGATHVTLDGDWVHVKQFSDAQGWISGASVKATSARQAVDVLVAMGILPVELSSAYAIGRASMCGACEGSGQEFAECVSYYAAVHGADRWAALPEVHANDLSGGAGMSALDLDAIKARANAATPGPWSADPTGTVCADADLIPDPNGGEILPADGPMEVAECYRKEQLDERARNADFIAHARQDVPALLAEVERLREANANLIRNAEILADEIVSGTRPVVS